MLSALDRGTPGLLLVYGLTALGLWLGVRRAGNVHSSPARPAFLPLAVVALPTTLGALILWALVQELALSSVPRALRFLLGVPFVVLIGAVTGRVLARRRPRVLHLRGTRLSTAAHTRRPPTDASTLTLAGVPIPAADETKHFKLLGTTGTGKSTAIRELLAGALARSDRALIADPDASYLGAFYDPARGDRILNPFDPRAARWDLFAELTYPHDAEQLARAFVPDHEGPERNWRQYARTFISAVLRQLHRTGEPTLARLYQLLFLAPVEALRDLLAATPAAPFLGADNVKFFESVRSIAAAHLSALEPLARQTHGAPLSVRHWVREGRGVLFLPYRAGQIASLRQLISAWMRLAVFQAMDAAADAPQAAERAVSPPAEPAGQGTARLWFVLDELDALGAIDGLKDALARLRKFGGRCVLGLQSIAQVRGLYGDAEAQTIIENCGNTLILRCSASEHGGTAEFASRLIGRREIVRHTQSLTRPARLGGVFHQTRTDSEHYAVEDAVLASEIEQLPDRAGFLKFASQPVWQRVTVPLPSGSQSLT